MKGITVFSPLSSLRFARRRTVYHITRVTRKRSVPIKVNARIKSALLMGLPPTRLAPAGPVIPPVGVWGLEENAEFGSPSVGTLFVEVALLEADVGRVELGAVEDVLLCSAFPGDEDSTGL
jgi:hypothetical protein